MKSRFIIFIMLIQYFAVSGQAAICSDFLKDLESKYRHGILDEKKRSGPLPHAVQSFFQTIAVSPHLRHSSIGVSSAELFVLSPADFKKLTANGVEKFIRFLNAISIKEFRKYILRPSGVPILVGFYNPLQFHKFSSEEKRYRNIPGPMKMFTGYLSDVYSISWEGQFIILRGTTFDGRYNQIFDYNNSSIYGKDLLLAFKYERPAEIETILRQILVDP